MCQPDRSKMSKVSKRRAEELRKLRCMPENAIDPTVNLNPVRQHALQTGRPL